MSLAEYQRKRDFARTSEPEARGGASATGHSFVVQKHAHRQLHYDFRLELDGVLKSWSVPKGPCFDPAVKRLAVAVEDHPIDYGDFEGIIPAGQYGGGTVLLWDRGIWKPVSDPVAALAKGHLKFELVGEKLRGRWALVRLNARGREHERNWLLVKDRDAYARPESEWSVTQARPESVATGRALDAISAAPDRVWHSDRAQFDASALPGARAAPMPERLRPPRPKRARAVPEGDEWLHEIEIVGEPALIRIEAGTVHASSFRGDDRSRDLEALVRAAQALPVGQAILMGVATALDQAGRPSAGALVDTLYLVDVLYLNGHDLTGVALRERKGLLAALMSAIPPRRDGGMPGLRYADHVLGRGREVLTHASALGAPGIISKRVDSRYPPAASAWRVVACPAHAPAAATPVRKASVGSAQAAQLRVAGVKLTHPERVLYPEVGITKADLAHFYARIAERILPHLVDRPLTLVRAPDGVAGQRFFVRHRGDWAPQELRSFDIAEGTGSGTTMIVDDVAGLVALAQMNVLEIHPWNARSRTLERPDRMVFDLDPGPQVPWSDVVDAAKYVRDVLATLNLESVVKTTGGKGLHVVVPLTPAASWEDTLTFSRTIAQALERFAPARFSANLTKAGREDKVFVDYLRNRRGATAVSVYSTRAHPSATVSVPVTWDDLGFGTRSDAFHVGDVDAWYAGKDPWAGYASIKQRLTASKIKAAQAALERAPRAGSVLRG